MSFTRRRFLQAAAAGGVLATAGPLTAPAAAAGRDVLVVVFLRGGLDGLSAVVPAGERGYHRSRKATRVGEGALVGLDNRFGLHPALAPLGTHFRSGDLAVVVGVGTPADTRSHFAQQSAVELGLPGRRSHATGWLARHLSSTGGGGMLRAMSAGTRASGMLKGVAGATTVTDLDRFRISGVTGDRFPTVGPSLVEVAGPGRFGSSARTAYETMKLVRDRGLDGSHGAHGARYRNDDTAERFADVAALIKAGVGLEAAVIDLGGWDTHRAQGGRNGLLADRLRELAAGLDAFYTDLRDLRDRLTVVVLSEFGRRVAENASGGTDHGRGGIAFVMGGGVHGGRVYGEWNGLDAGELHDGDVPVTVDARDVLGEIVRNRLANPNVDAVFPGHRLRPLEIVAPR